MLLELKQNLKLQMQFMLLFTFFTFHFPHYFKKNGPSVNKVSCTFFSLSFPNLLLTPSPIPPMFSLPLLNWLMSKQ